MRFNKGIFFTTRAVTGREGKGIIAHMGIMDNQSPHIDLLTQTKSKQSKMAIKSYSGLSVDKTVNLYEDFYKNTAKNMSDWMEVYDALDVSQLEQYDNLYLIGGVDLWRSKLTRGNKRNFVFPKDRGQLKFESCGSVLINMLALLKAHREYNTPLHELAFDPNEMSLDLVHPDVAPKDNYYLYHGYDIPDYNMKRLDSLQYFLGNSVSLGESSKKYDFTFGFTVLENSGRTDYSSFIYDHASKFANANVFCKNYLTGENTLVNRDAYLNYIAHSRFTLLLPSYDSKCFSIYRFIESIHNDCLPMLHKNCNISDVEKSFGIDMKPLMCYDIPNEKTRLELLDYYKKKMLNVERGFT